MALKMLGQARPGAGVTATVYQVPVSMQAVGNIVICNTDIAVADQFILYLVPAAGSPGVANAIYRGEIPAEESFDVFGIAMTAGESIRMFSTGGKMTVTMTGNES